MPSNKCPKNYIHDEILTQIKKIVLNNENTPYLVPELISSYIGEMKLKLDDKYPTDKCLKQIKFVCKDYDSKMKFNSDEKLIEPTINQTYLLIILYQSIVKGSLRMLKQVSH